MPDVTKHDPLDQYQDENDLELEEIEKATDTAEVEAAEEAAVNTDTEIAQEADAASVLEKEVTPELEKEAALVEEALDRKHKNRESTSEKSKRAAEERAAKGSSPEPIARKQLDPLRLRGKKYRAKIALVDKSKTYSVEEAVELVKQTSYSSFDATVEMHVKVKGEAVRGTLTLPHGTGKTRKVAVATDEVIEAIAAGKLEFDVLLATPAQMPKLAKFAKVLGPKGLMPSPKAGTVTEDVDRVKEEISGGRIEYRTDKTGVVHASIGRVSFDAAKLVENFKVLEQALISSKILSISLASTMGPGVKVELSK